MTDTPDDLTADQIRALRWLPADGTIVRADALPYDRWLALWTLAGLQPCLLVEYGIPVADDHAGTYRLTPAGLAWREVNR